MAEFIPGVLPERCTFSPFDIFVQIVQRRNLYPVRILKSGKATIVFWQDGSKTVVKCSADETPDDYDAFTAALAIKIFGSNSQVKKIVKTKTEQQVKKGKVK